MRFALIIIFALSTFAIGCKKSAHDHHAHGDDHAKTCEASLTSDQYAGREIVDQPGATIGDLARCPISGAVFEISESSPSAEQKSEMYYVCCGGCITQLEESFARRR